MDAFEFSLDIGGSRRGGDAQRHDVAHGWKPIPVSRRSWKPGWDWTAVVAKREPQGVACGTSELTPWLWQRSRPGKGGNPVSFSVQAGFSR
jgi:hypothetical protein